MDIKNILNKQSVVLGLTTMIITLSTAAAGCYQEWKNIWILLGIVFSIIYICLLVYYSKVNENIKELKLAMSGIENDRKAFERMMQEFQALSKNYAEMFEESWDFEEFCKICCEAIYRIFAELKIPDAEISVSYETFYKRSNKKYIKMIAQKNKSGARPKIYKKERSLAKNGYYDIQVLLEQNPEIVILASKEEIRKHFKSGTTDVCKYNQYIAIPNVDKNNEILGLLQIIAFGNTKIGNTYEEIRKRAISYGMPLVSLLLLFEKKNRSMKVSLREEVEINEQASASRPSFSRKKKK